MTQKKFQLFIFRRDLRIQDNTTLEVLHKFPEPIIPIFIFSPDQIDPIKNPYFSNNWGYVCFTFSGLRKVKRTLTG